MVRGFGLERGYPMVPLLAYTPYVALLGLPIAGLVALLGRRLPAALIAGSAIVLIALVAPRAFPSEPEVSPAGPGVRILTANLMLGEADVGAIEEQVRDGAVDVLSIAELTPDADAAITDSEIAELLPYRVAEPQRGSAGTGIYSRFPLERLPAAGATGNDLPTVIAAASLPGGGSAEIYSIHPYPPSSSGGVAQIGRYLESIPSADPAGAPRLLAGDFNATLDNATVRDLLDRGYADAADAAGEGVSWTWPQDLFPPPVTIDHVIYDERVQVLEYETAELPGSDHRMVLAGLRLPATG